MLSLFGWESGKVRGEFCMHVWWAMNRIVLGGPKIVWFGSGLRIVHIVWLGRAKNHMVLGGPTII
jgi:hypothetical protein